MPISFQHAPLVELVAELRWATTAGFHVQGGAGGVQFGFGTPQSSQEEFYSRFGERAEAAGFSASERLVPQGFPSPPYSVAYRYKRSGQSTKELLQVGPGVFTANALRPYQSWHVFRPSVVSGIEALLQTRTGDDAEKPFISVALRYINAFGNELTAGMTPARMLRDVLQINLGLPDAITSHLAAGSEVTPSMRLVLATARGQTVTINVGDGTTGDARSFILDTTISAGSVAEGSGPIEPHPAAVMKALDEARDVHHDMFLKLTQRLHDQMGPEGKDG